MALKPGTLSDYNGSMAEAIEQAFGAVWTERMGSSLPTQMQQDRRMMFVAIAQGVIKHLRDEAAASFDVAVDVEQTTPRIASSGTASGAHTHPVTVTQSSNSSNRVQSTGNGTVTLNTDGVVY